MKQISVLITDTQYKQLLKIKEDDELKQADVIRQSIDLFLDDYKIKKVQETKQTIIDYVKLRTIHNNHEHYKSFMLFTSPNSRYYDKKFSEEVDMILDMQPNRRKIIGIIGKIIRLLQNSNSSGVGNMGITHDKENIYIATDNIKYQFNINGNIDVEEFVETIIKHFKL